MKKQIQLSSKSPHKQSFIDCFGDKKSNFANSTVYSVLTGKRIKTDAEIHDNIKVKRALSYKKLSFSLRKNQILLKGTKKIDNCESNDKESAIKSILQLKSKRQLSIQKFKPFPSGLNNFNKEFGSKFAVKKNIISQGELINDGTSKSQSPIKKMINERAMRMKTEHQNEKQINAIEIQILRRKNTEDLDIKKKNTHLVTAVVASQKQESKFIKKLKIPGVNFKPEKSSRHLVQTKNKSTLSASSLFNQGKKSTYLHENQLLKYDDSDRGISELYELRLKNNLKDLPKQWHFYNCLRMNQLSLYRTNLKLSCQSWILIDHLQLKYLRGWHPKQVMQFDIAKRLFLSLLALQLKFEYKVDLKKAIMKVNNSSLRRKMNIPSSILLDSQFTLKNNTIISLEDLLMGVIITKKQDLFWHLAYGICSLYRTYNFQAGIPSQQIQSSQIYIQEQLQYLKSLDLIFIQKCKQICEKRNLTQTSIQLKIKKHQLIKNDKLVHGLKYENSVFKEGNEFQYLHILSSCVDISILFMQCLTYSFFQQIIVNPYIENMINCLIKVQVGYKFWQNQPHKWKNEYTMYQSKNFGAFQGRNEQSKSLSIISYNSTDKVVIICNDCRLNMCFRDISGIQGWMHETFNRFKKPKMKNEIIYIQNC